MIGYGKYVPEGLTKSPYMIVLWRDLLPVRPAERPRAGLFFKEAAHAG